MEEIFNDIYAYIMQIIASSSVYGPLFACLLIMIESIIPALPLFVFITIVFIAYGYVFGFLISYVLTCIGCFLSFFLFRRILKKFVTKKIRKFQKFDKVMKKIDNMQLSSLVLLLSIPFTPAFLINIAASLSNIDFKKYAIAIFIGKISLVFFWGFIGTSLVESLKNPRIIIIILIMLLIAYILSKIITKKLKVD